jgi:hypothetical protein
VHAAATVAVLGVSTAAPRMTALRRRGHLDLVPLGGARGRGEM